LAMALVFVPVLGGTLGKGDASSLPPTAGRLSAWYGDLLGRLLRHPLKVLGVALVMLIGTYMAYGLLGKGVEFFPDVEPEVALVQIHARGDFSIYEKDAMVRRVESRILGMPELESVYARSFNQATGQNQAEDVIGVIQMQFVDWNERRPAAQILEEMRQRTSDIAGIKMEFRKQENGPAQGKPIQLEFSSRFPERIPAMVEKVRSVMDELGGFVDVEDNRPLPGIEWRLEMDRERAARYGADVALLGNAVQMVTQGIKVSEYRPEDNDDEVDIRVRFPYDVRNLDQLDQLRVPTSRGMVPISNFVELTPAAKTGTLNRTDARRVMTIQSDVAEGLLVDNKLKELVAALQAQRESLDPLVSIQPKGESEDQQEAATFLSNAFLTAIFLMAVILVTQFNSIYQAFIVLSAIVFSTAGVLIGLMVTAQPFGIVMVGLGIIALAGIVVNNNIVLIDTYNRIREKEPDPVQAALKTGKLRLRPVFLTALTTVLGLMPMVLAMNIDLINRDITFGAPSTQWWTQLASAIAGGLTFATFLTLLLTPCLLVIGDKILKGLPGR
ncbi:MAG: efflux RND transporter permease subunit, partial [Gammaproteobacteria bacterium]|nr:efflux RND transporter permease subunit [Gammaproteobacteria bacterium]